MTPPVWLRCLLAAILVATLGLAYWGRPPRRAPGAGMWSNLAGIGLGLYCSGCGTLIAGQAALSAALIGSGVETLALVAWMSRGPSGEEDGGAGDEPSDGDDPGGGGHDDDGPPGWSDGDERAFRDYVAHRERPREPVAG